VISANFIPRTLQWLKTHYALDIRALSLMRVLAGVVLLADLVIRATSLNAFYTGQGVVPFKEVESAWWRNGYFTLFQFSDEYWYATLLFSIAAIVYLCFLIGYRTRILSVLAWLMLLSIQNRNHAILQCGDDVLRLVLFWGIFLPWGNFYSVDAKRYPGLQSETKYFNVPGIAYILLIFSVYFFTGILKDSPEWDSREGSAYYYALNLDQMTWPLGKMLLPHTGLLKFLTISAKWIEIIAPFLLFIPFKNAWFRMLFFFVLTGFQLAIGLTLFVGLFYLINIVAIIGLLSPKAMDKIESWFKIKRPVLTGDEIQYPGEVLSKNYYFRVVVNCFVLFCMALCFLWNVGNTEGWGLRVAPGISKFGFALRLDQRWNMFAPKVFKDDGWFVMEGISKDKRRIDINRDGKPVDFSKPESVLSYIRDDRWRKYQENFVIPENLFMQNFYCKYLIKNWNQYNPENPVDSLNLVYMKEFTPPPGQTPEVKKEILCKCWK